MSTNNGWYPLHYIINILIWPGLFITLQYERTIINNRENESNNSNTVDQNTKLGGTTMQAFLP